MLALGRLLKKPKRDDREVKEFRARVEKDRQVLGKVISERLGAV